MINLPNELLKGSSLTFTLDKEAVLAAVSDPYWSEATNVKVVVVVYRSVEGNQQKELRFDMSAESPTASAVWSERSRDVYQIADIILQDYDLDFYQIPPSSFPSGKGIDFNPPVPSTLFFAFDGGNTNTDAGFDTGEFAS